MALRVLQGQGRGCAGPATEVERASRACLLPEPSMPDTCPSASLTNNSLDRIVILGWAHRSTACPIIPLNPRALTPWPPSANEGTACAGRTTPAETLATRSATRGFRTYNCAFANARAAATSRCTFRSATCPDAASLCPTAAFAAPMVSGIDRSEIEWTAARAPASVGSPSAVPVPCASEHPTSAADSAARRSADMISARCAEPFGAVRLADRPSWRTALPASRMCSALQRLSPSAPTPSERAYPLARASHVLHLPSVESIPADAAPNVGYGTNFRATAIAVEFVHSPHPTARAPKCKATKAEAQAASILAQGPCAPSTNESRPAATDTLSLVTE
eukprot:4375748-Prymnesium_polylepis.1